jgi:hypothetical protein
MSIPQWFGPGAWGVAIGAVGAMIIGFSWGGWVTGSTAEKMAAGRAEKAVVAVYTPVCVANAKRAGAEQLAKLKAENSWERGDYVIEAGWVGKVGEAYREAVADACAPKVVDSMKTDVKPS